jgi:putative membrane protein
MRRRLALLAVVGTLLGGALLAPGPAGSATGRLTLQERNCLAEVFQDARAATRMSLLAIDRAGSEAVRDYARRIAADNARIAGRVGALAERKDVSLPGTLDNQTMAYIQILGALAGPAFDRRYLGIEQARLNHMARRHEAMTAQARDADIRALASDAAFLVHDHAAQAQSAASEGE